MENHDEIIDLEDENLFTETLLTMEEEANYIIYEASNEADKLLYIRLRCGSGDFKALVDTGATQSAIPQKDVDQITMYHKECIMKWREPKYSSVRLASGDVIKTKGEVQLFFTIGGKKSNEWFLILENMNQAILGMSYFEKEDIIIDTKRRRLLLPEMTVQISEIFYGPTERDNKIGKHKIPIITIQDQSIPGQSYELVKCKPKRQDENDLDVSGIIEPNTEIFDEYGVYIVDSLGKVDKNHNIMTAMVNATFEAVTIPKGTLIGKLTIPTSRESHYITQMSPRVLDCSDPLGLENTIISESQFNTLAGLDTDYTTGGIQVPTRTQYWFPTPENCKNPEKLEGVPKQIYDQLKKFKKDEELDPTKDEESRKEFLDKISWEGSQFSGEERKEVEDLLVEYHMIFGRHRMDVGKNEEFKIKLTPEHDKPVYTQSPPTPIHMRDELLVELALMQYYDILTTLPYSKYSSPIFAQRKPSGKLRLLVDLRRINHLIRDDYDRNNFPISTIQDAGAHLAGKTYFSSLDCAQAYFALQMADERSIQLLAI